MTSLLSQVPNWPEWVANASRLSWLILLLLLLMREHQLQLARFGRFFLTFAVLITAYVLFCSITSPAHLQSFGFRLMFPPLIIYFSGYYLRTCISERELKLLFLLYFIYSAILMLYVFNMYIRSLTLFIEHLEYLYASKNSLSRIIGAGALFFIALTPQKRYMRYGSLIVAGIFMFCLLLLRSRASLLGVVIGIAYYMFKKKQYVYLTVAAIFLIAYIVLLFQDYQYVGGLSSEQAFILRSLNLDRHDEINRFSGGRVELFKATLYVIADNLWIGIGRCAWPVDNFYLSLLVQMGMLGCPLFFAIVFYRVFLNLVRLPQQFRNDDIMVFLEIVTVMNFVVAFFEGGGFLGPGQTTMPLWLLAGYFDAGAQISASQSDAAAENAE